MILAVTPILYPSSNINLKVFKIKSLVIQMKIQEYAGKSGQCIAYQDKKLWPYGLILTRAGE